MKITQIKLPEFNFTPAPAIKSGGGGRRLKRSIQKRSIQKRSIKRRKSIKRKKSLGRRKHKKQLSKKNYRV